MNYRCKTDRLTEVFICDLAAGHFDSEEYLPSEVRLTEQYRVSRNTIRRMLDNLISDGTLLRDETRRVRINPNRQQIPEGNGTRKLTFSWAYAAYPDPMIFHVTAGIQAYTAEHQVNLQFITSQESHESVLTALERVPRLGIDGVLILNYRNDAYDRRIDQLLDQGVPVVTIGSPGKSHASSVSGDDFGGAYRALSHLIEKYDRPVYLLAAPADPADLANNERYQAFALAMTNAGFGDLIEKNCFLIPNGDAPKYWSMNQKLFRSTYQFAPCFARMKFPASVFCSDDYMAHRLYLAAQENNLAIGRDLMVIGFDDLPFARRLNPPLSTIRVDSQKLGHLAANLLHQLTVDSVSSPVHLKVPAEFIDKKQKYL